MTVTPRHSKTFFGVEDKNAPPIAWIGVNKNGQLYIDGWAIDSGDDMFVEACEYLLMKAKEERRRVLDNLPRA